ncbi:MAG: cation diffusion facilitator family transporter, partial [Mycobacterium sp.]|nr:cation diffusion facilitator family transporter [Mycobacterium sp.]
PVGSATPMAYQSGRTVLVALGANAMVAVAKIAAGVVGGSQVMWAEAGHSVSDTFNQAFLYTSVRRSRKEPDRQHPFGYGKERFFWALIAAVSIFVAGAGFSLYEATEAFAEAPSAEPKEFGLNYAVFGFALVVESISGIRAYRQTRQEARDRGRTFTEHVKLSPDPSVKTVVSEDSVAVIGNLLGISATVAHHVTGQPLWDGVAALLIMAMLIFVAFALARDNKDLLVGEALEPEDEQKIVDFLRQQDAVTEVLELLTMRLGTESTLVVARVDFADHLSASDVKSVSQGVERELRDAFPEVQRVFLDPKPG